MSDSEEHLVTATAEAARATLARNCTAKGLSAAAEHYPQVWTRDTVLTFLGASIDGDPQMLKVFAQSLDILGSAQNRFGQVPYLVALADDKAAFGGSDSDQWWVIGCCRYAALSGDRAWLAGHAEAIVRACDHIESRDQDDSGLMHSCECEDWADLIANRGKFFTWGVDEKACAFLAAHGFTCEPYTPRQQGTSGTRTILLGDAPADPDKQATWSAIRQELDAGAHVIAAGFAVAYASTGGYDSGLLIGLQRVGRGSLLFNALAMLEHLGRHPAADRLLLNMLTLDTSKAAGETGGGRTTPR